MGCFYFEFYGLPGSGKTTALQSASETVADQSFYINGKSIHSDSDIRLNNNIVEALRCSMRSVKLIVKYGLYDEEILRKVKAALVLHARMSSWALIQGRNIKIYNDNGYIQILVSILKRKNTLVTDNFICDYFDTFINMKFPCRFIFLRTDVITCLGRIYARGKKLSIMSTDQAKTEQSLYYELDIFEKCTNILNTRYSANKFFTLIIDD
jgi:hypothetical protein